MFEHPHNILSSLEHARIGCSIGVFLGAKRMAIAKVVAYKKVLDGMAYMVWESGLHSAIANAKVVSYKKVFDGMAHMVWDSGLPFAIANPNVVVAFSVLGF
jgi:hypothetical protein